VAVGVESGTIAVRLSSSTDAPALPDLSKLTVSAPNSGLAFGEFSEIFDEESELLEPTGVYRASFTGTKAGEWPIQVLYDGQPVAVEDGANATAYVVGDTASSLDLRVSVAHRCMGPRAYLNVTAFNDSDEPAEVTISTPYGTRAFAPIRARSRSKAGRTAMGRARWPCPGPERVTARPRARRPRVIRAHPAGGRLGICFGLRAQDRTRHTADAR
jgi:hypothetical protein